MVSPNKQASKQAYTHVPQSIDGYFKVSARVGHTGDVPLFTESLLTAHIA